MCGGGTGAKLSGQAFSFLFYLVLFWYIYNFLLHLLVFFAYMYVCSRGSEALELELQTGVSCHVRAGK